MSKHNLVISMSGYDIIVTFENVEFIKKELANYWESLMQERTAPRVYTRGEKGVSVIKRYANDEFFYFDDIVININAIQSMHV